MDSSFGTKSAIMSSGTRAAAKLARLSVTVNGASVQTKCCIPAVARVLPTISWRRTVSSSIGVRCHFTSTMTIAPHEQMRAKSGVCELSSLPVGNSKVNGCAAM